MKHLYFTIIMYLLAINLMAQESPFFRGQPTKPIIIPIIIEKDLVVQPIPADQQKVSITWIVPEKENEQTYEEEKNIEFKLSLKNIITDVKIQVNGQYRSFELQDYTEENITKKVKFKEGNNSIKVIVTLKDGSTQEFNRNILYKKEDVYIEGDYYALLIGVDQYGGNGFENLKKPVEQVGRIGTVLKDNYSFKEVIIKQNVTRKELDKELENLKKKLKSNDKLLIMFSGHGTEGRWQLKDANNKEDTSMSIDALEVYSFFKETKLKHIFVIIDACYAVSFTTVINYELQENKKKERNNTENELEIKYNQLMMTRSNENSKLTENANETTICELFPKSISHYVLTSGANQQVIDNDTFTNILIQSLKNEKGKDCFSSNDLYKAIENSWKESSHRPKYNEIHIPDASGIDFIFPVKKD